MNGTNRAMGVVGWLYVASGVALAAVSFWPAGLLAVVQLVLPGTSSVDAAAQVLAGVGGGLTAGLGAMITSLARPRADGDGARRAVAVGLCTWCLIDSAASIGHGAWRNAVGNALFLAIGLLPLWSRYPRATPPAGALDRVGSAGPALPG